MAKPRPLLIDLTGDDCDGTSSGESPNSSVVDLTGSTVPSPAAPRHVGASRAAGPGAQSKPEQVQQRGAGKRASPKAKNFGGASGSRAGNPSKQGGGKRAKKEEPEKRQNAYGRTVPLSKHPSQKVRERMERAMPGSGHRMYVLSQRTVAPLEAAGGPIEEYTILGATGNVYTVSIGRHSSCNCPDAVKGNLCKHHLFVMIRVLRLAADDFRVWQRALLTAEAVEVLSGERSVREASASEALQKAYRAAAVLPTSSGAAASQQPARPLEGECPICYDELSDGGDGSNAQKAVVTCSTCSQHLHQECFSKWAQTNRGGTVTCVYCRAPWLNSAAAAGLPALVGKTGDLQYINLASQSQEHADTTLDGLYGNSAVWIRYHQGRGGSRTAAARLWNLTR